MAWDPEANDKLQSFVPGRDLRVTWPVILVLPISADPTSLKPLDWAQAFVPRNPGCSLWASSLRHTSEVCPRASDAQP